MSSTREVTFGQKLSIGTTILGFGGTIVAITMAWGKFDTRVTVLETSMAIVQQGQERERQNRDILIELKTDMGAVKNSVQRLEGRQVP